MINNGPPKSLEVERQLLVLALRQLPTMLAATLGSTLGIAAVFAHDGHGWAWRWWAGMATLLVLRTASLYTYIVEPFRAQALGWMDLERLRARYGVGLYASAIGWMIPALGATQTATTAQYSLIVVATGLAAGATGITASLRAEGRIYIVLMALPVSMLLMLGAPGLAIVGALGLIFTGAMVSVHIHNHNVLRRSLELQIEKETLATDLRSLNSGLEDKVAERTQALERIANRDSLTGLPNRRGLMDWMQRRLQTDGPHDAAVLFLDLDRFKQINDALGHDIGDQVLQATALRMADCVPGDGILARWGGDEFVLVLANSPDIRARAEAAADRLLASVTLPFDAEGQNLGLGVSVGMAYFPTDAATHKDAILAADLAVAEVKKKGRGRAMAYSETYAETQRRRFDLGCALGAAIQSDGLSLHYQPIVDAGTGQVAALEALVRWSHPELGEINPQEFVGLAEDSDRIVALGQWVLRRACADARGWDKGEGGPKVSVNVSVKQLLSDDFLPSVVQAVTLAGLPAGRLELEVTESLFDDEHTDQMLAVVESLACLGVQVNIDDFGTGYSSLSRLHSFPVAAVKIDRSFVAQLDGQGGVIVESTVMIARRFGLKVVAEGVETAEQAAALTAMGVDYLQGFHFGRPSAKAALGVVRPGESPAPRAEARPAAA